MNLRAAGLLVVLSWASHSAYGESITNLAGTVFREVKVLRVEPDGISIDHSGGLAKITFNELAPDVQLKYGYDPEKAARYRQKVLEARRARQASQAQQAQAQAQAAAEMFPVDVSNLDHAEGQSMKELGYFLLFCLAVSYLIPKKLINLFFRKIK